MFPYRILDVSNKTDLGQFYQSPQNSPVANRLEFVRATQTLPAASDIPYPAGFLIYFARTPEIMTMPSSAKAAIQGSAQIFQTDPPRVSKKVKKVMKTEKEQAEKTKELQKLRSDLLKRIIQNEQQRRNPQANNKR